MSEPHDQAPEPADAAAAEEARRRRRALVFGEVLPETTSDERGPSSEQGNDSWLRDNVPPHHGG